jgi:hypothetical protein
MSAFSPETLAAAKPGRASRNRSMSVRLAVGEASEINGPSTDAGLQHINRRYTVVKRRRVT